MYSKVESDIGVSQMNDPTQASFIKNPNQSNNKKSTSRINAMIEESTMHNSSIQQPSHMKVMKSSDSTAIDQLMNSHISSTVQDSQVSPRKGTINNFPNISVNNHDYISKPRHIYMQK